MEQKIYSKLVTSKSLLELNGYKLPPHYIGLHNNLWLYCNNHFGYSQHILMVKDTYNWRYVCDSCNYCVEYVG